MFISLITPFYPVHATHPINAIYFIYFIYFTYFYPPMPCIIGVDIGTSSTKAIAWSDEGKAIASSQQSYSIHQPRPGFQEQDPQILLQAVLECMDKLTLRLNNKSEIAGVSFSCAMHGLMAIGENNEPLTNIITWADTRSTAESDHLRQSPLANYLYQRCGVPIHPMTPLCKILWLKNHQAELFSRTKKFVGFKDYLFYQLFGKWLIDHSLASGSGLFDIHELKWNEIALTMAGIREDQLPKAVSTLHTESDLLPSLRKRWNLEENTPFIIGASDGCLANLGTGALATGDLAITVGTSGAVRKTHNRPEADKQGRTFNYLLAPGLYVSGGPINNGGIILKWFAENFLHRSFEKGDDFAWFLDEAAKAPPGSDGLICLPYFIGERAPVWDASAKGLFYGVQLHHRREHFMRAIVEGISMTLLQIAEILKEKGKGTAPNHIYVSGGFVKSDNWMQIMADIFGQPIHVTNTSDASTIGAAMLGWHKLGKIRSLEEAKQWVEIQKTFYPDHHSRELYNVNFSIFTKLYERTKF